MCNIYLVDISDFIYSHFFNVTCVYLLIKEEMRIRKEHGTCIAEGSTKYACTCSEFIVYYFIGSFLPCFQENLVILDLV